MKRALLIGLAAATVLAGCGLLAEQDDKNRDPSRPAVSIKGGRIVVSPDPLVFTPDKKDVTIRWSLPKDSKLTFARNGIVIEGEQQSEIVRCMIGEDPQTFSCLNRHTKPGEYKYTIRLLDNGKPLDPLDPTVRNM